MNAPTYTVVEPTVEEHEARWARMGRAPARGTLRQCDACGARVWAGNGQQFHTKTCPGPKAPAFPSDFHSETRVVTTKAGRTYLAHAYRIITTNLVVVDVYEPGASYCGRHSTLHSFEGFGLCGGIASRHAPANLDALTPGSWERIERVHVWHARLDKLSQGIIDRAFPECAEGNHRGADRTVTIPQVQVAS